MPCFCAACRRRAIGGNPQTESGDHRCKVASSQACYRTPSAQTAAASSSVSGNRRAVEKSGNARETKRWTSWPKMWPCHALQFIAPATRQHEECRGEQPRARRRGRGLPTKRSLPPSVIERLNAAEGLSLRAPEARLQAIFRFADEVRHDAPAHLGFPKAPGPRVVLNKSIATLPMEQMLRLEAVRGT
jgi:hypothetical protein